MRRLLAAAAVLALAGLVGCSSSGSSDGATTTSAPATSSSSTTSSPSTTAASSTTSTTATPSGCTGGATTPPAGAATGTVPDVDGDGRPDTAWVGITDPDTGEVQVGINTAAGGGATTIYRSASPIDRSVLVVDVDEQAPVELIFSDGRSAELHAFVDCAIVPVTNPQGRTYAFDLGNRIGTGTGIGCIDTPDGRRLVGLQRRTSADTSVVHWKQTIIELDGTRARNGATTTGTYRSPADDAAIARLDAITCGATTMADDGITYR